MEVIEFMLIHDGDKKEPQQEIEDWEMARAVVKARLGEHRYNCLTQGES